MKGISVVYGILLLVIIGAVLLAFSMNPVLDSDYQELKQFSSEAELSAFLEELFGNFQILV